MKKIIQINIRTILSCMAILLSFSMYSQEIRSYNGENNNLQNPEYGAVGTNQLQYSTIGYSDGISEPAGLTRPNPRHVSNAIFNQDELIHDIMELSDFAWVWGQFIDHDITLITDNKDESCNIAVPSGDPYFDPANTGNVEIRMHRSAWDINSGTDPSNPRAFPNQISSFIDASAVYGSNLERAQWLRSFEGGKLRTSTGNLLPYNTITGELDSEIDPTAPEMAMDVPHYTKWFVAGDIRANENPLLSSFHTIFMREHNRLCDVIAAENPNWNDEEIYQKARKYVGGLMQAVVYEEWLPTLGMAVEPYTGYDDQLEVGIMNVFSAAAYRYGHTVINGTLVRMDNEGNILPEGNILLREAFFNPTAIPEVGGIAPYLKGMATQVEQEFDCKMIHDLRNFLFGAPGAGGLDLAAINVMRGRERGLPDYNTAREDFGMERIESFSSLSANPWLNQVLENTYGDIDNVDAWVGFLAEDHMSNALFGECVMKIVKKQFMMLRNGDRFYYENDSGLSPSEISEIKSTRFSDIIKRNCDVTGIQADVFVAKEHTVTSIAENSQLIQYDVFPNPTNGKLFINIGAESTELGHLSISNAYGQIVHTHEVRVINGMNTIEFELPSELPPGLYFSSLRIGDSIGHESIIKN